MFEAYILIVYFLLVNMFMAIVLDTYTMVTYGRYTKGQRAFSKDSIIWCFLISWLGKLSGEVFRPGDEHDDDRGTLEEEFIETAALPEVQCELLCDFRW